MQKESIAVVILTFADSVLFHLTHLAFFALVMCSAGFFMLCPMYC